VGAGLAAAAAAAAAAGAAAAAAAAVADAADAAAHVVAVAAVVAAVAGAAGDAEERRRQREVVKGPYGHVRPPVQRQGHAARCGDRILEGTMARQLAPTAAAAAPPLRRARLRCGLPTCG